MSDKYVKLDDVVRILKTWFPKIDCAYQIKSAIELKIANLPTKTIDETEFKVGDEVWIYDYCPGHHSSVHPSKIYTVVQEINGVFYRVDGEKLRTSELLFKTREEAETALLKLKQE